LSQLFQFWTKTTHSVRRIISWAQIRGRTKEAVGLKIDGWRLDELWVPSEQNQFGEFASDD